MATALMERAEAAHKHARYCKKELSKCPTCQTGIFWFASLSLTDLNKVLSEPAPQRRDR